MIYQLCLCVEGVFFPYLETYKDQDYDFQDRKPTVALLALNRNIRNGALPVLFEENVWRITDTQVDLAGTDYDNEENDEIEADTLWKRYGSYIKHLTVAYNHKDQIPCLIADYIRSVHYQIPDTRQKRAKDIHGGLLVNMNNSWLSVMKNMEYCTHIGHLNIDIIDLYCAIGCCRTNRVKV